MADNDGKTQNNTWPLPKFYFEVKIDKDVISFQEVSGLDMETQVIEYRHGNDKVFSNSKMPGLQKTSNVTLKKGIFIKDDFLWKWFNEIKMNTIARKTVIISLLDQEGKPAMSWTLKNAFPTKITGTDMKADGNEVAVESVELAHEGLSVTV